LRPKCPDSTRVLFLAEYAPDAPIFEPKSFSADGGYPLYHFHIWEALNEVGYRVLSASKPYAALLSGGNADFVFSLYNRMPLNNSEVLVSAFCEYVRIPYLGARPNIRALAEDKWLSKLVARSIGIPTAPGIPYGNFRDLAEPPPFVGPYFIKERFGAGSEGITVESVQEDWEGARRIARRFIERGQDALVEQFAPGLDVTVPVIGGDREVVLGFVHPASDKPNNILTEDLKRDDPLGYQIYDVGRYEQDFRDDAAALWDAAGPIDYLRIDYRFDPNSGRRVFLEFNICCYIGEAGAICLAAHRWGISQIDLLGHVVEYGLRRQSFGREHLEWVL
jgi:D-alanine-D-alanine ligase